MSTSRRLYRVVQDVHGRPQRELVGACWLARRDVAVTARHSVAVEPKQFEIDDLGTATIVAEDADADIAILRLASPTAVDSMVFATSIRRRAAWHADGFPNELEGERFTMSGSVTSLDGDRAACSTLQRHLEQGAAAAWEGVSGAAVVVDGAVIGVVTEVITNLSSARGSTITVVRRLLATLDGITSPVPQLELHDESPASHVHGSGSPPAAALFRAPAPQTVDPWQRLLGKWIEISPIFGAPGAPPPDRIFRVERVDDLDIHLQKRSSQQYVTLPRRALSAPWALSQQPRAEIVIGTLIFDPRTNVWQWEPTEARNTRR
jgi:hypothetical protein